MGNTIKSKYELNVAIEMITITTCLTPTKKYPP